MVLEIKSIGIEPNIAIHSVLNFQGFSSTDLEKNPENPGIVYPLDNPKNQLSVSSIVDHKKKKTNLAHCEARIADTEILKDGTKKITYTQHICISVVLRKEEQKDLSHLAESLGFEKDENIGNPENYIVTSKPVSDVAKFSKFSPLKSLIETFSKMSFKADTDLVLSKNLFRKSYPLEVITNDLKETSKKKYLKLSELSKELDMKLPTETAFEENFSEKKRKELLKTLENKIFSIGYPKEVFKGCNGIERYSKCIDILYFELIYGAKKCGI